MGLYDAIPLRDSIIRLEKRTIKLESERVVVLEKGGTIWEFADLGCVARYLASTDQGALNHYLDQAKTITSNLSERDFALELDWSLYESDPNFVKFYFTEAIQELFFISGVSYHAGSIKMERPTYIKMEFIEIPPDLLGKGLNAFRRDVTSRQIGRMVQLGLKLRLFDNAKKSGEFSKAENWFAALEERKGDGIHTLIRKNRFGSPNEFLADFILREGGVLGVNNQQILIACEPFFTEEQKEDFIIFKGMGQANDWVRVEMAKETEKAETNIQYFRNLFTENRSLTDQESMTFLDEDTALLQYQVSVHTVDCMFVTSSMSKNVSSKITKDDLRDQITRLQENLSLTITGISDHGKINLILQDLFIVLIQPLYPEISSFKRLIIIPDDILFLCPFDALQLPGELTKSMVDEYIINIVPSFTTFALMNARRYQLLRDRRGRLTVFGNPDRTLPDSEKEASDIFTLSGNDKPLLALGQDADLCALRYWGTTFGNCSVLHIASHGVYKQDSPEDSYLQLSRTIRDNGRLTVNEISCLDMRLELVSLAACNTALRPLNPSKSAFSIAAAFIVAGTQSVISTLWDIDDEASALIFREYYKYILEGSDRVEALTQAKRTLRKNQPMFRQPAYWAGIIISGIFEPIRYEVPQQSDFQWVNNNNLM